MKSNKNSYEKQGSFQILFEIWKNLRKKRKLQLFSLNILNLFSSFSESLSIAMTLPLISVLINPNLAWDIIWVQKLFINFGIYSADNLRAPITIIFVFASLISTLIKLSIIKANHFFSAAIGNDLSCLAYSRTLNQSYEEHIELNSSELISAATNYVDTTVFTIYSFLNLLSNISLIITIELTLFLFKWEVALSSLLIFCSAYLYISFKSKQTILKNGKLIAQLIKERVKSIQEGLGSIREVILGNKQNIFINQYSNLDSIYRKKLATNKFITFYPKYIIENIGLIFIALLAYKFSTDIESSQKILPIIGTFAVASQKLLPSMQQCYNSIGAIRSNKGSIIKVLEMINRHNYKIQINDIQPLKFQKEISLTNVYFKYLNSNKYILNDINVVIRKGEKLGIIGTTGSGKTTFTDILMGLLKPNKGLIKIDNNNIYDVKNPNIIIQWRLAISHVPQNIFLSDNSIAENIAFGIPFEKIDFAKIKEVAKRAQISNFINSTAKKYLTKVGENGLKLSGGQRQRIGIARALYQDSQVIIFDEATSALDNNTESAVIDSLNKLDANLTIIIVAHRLSTIEKCDRVIKIDKNKISEIN